jgi:hypothetical protein
MYRPYEYVTELETRAGKIRVGDLIGPFAPKDHVMTVERITQKVIDGTNWIFCWDSAEVYSFPAKSHVTIRRSYER